MSTMRGLVVPLTLAILVFSIAAAMGGCGPSAAARQSGAESTEDAATAVESTAPAPGVASSAPTRTRAVERVTTAPGAGVSQAPASIPGVAADSPAATPRGPSGILDQQWPARAPPGEPRRANGGQAGRREVRATHWEDGDRTLTVHLENDTGTPHRASVGSQGGNVVQQSGGETSSDEAPVFRSASGTLMTLPGGVLLVLDPGVESGPVTSSQYRSTIPAQSALPLGRSGVPGTLPVSPVWACVTGGPASRGREAASITTTTKGHCFILK